MCTPVFVSDGTFYKGADSKPSGVGQDLTAEVGTQTTAAD